MQTKLLDGFRDTESYAYSVKLVLVCFKEGHQEVVWIILVDVFHHGAKTENK